MREHAAAALHQRKLPESPRLRGSRSSALLSRLDRTDEPAEEQHRLEAKTPGLAPRLLRSVAAHHSAPTHFSHICGHLPALFFSLVERINEMISLLEQEEENKYEAETERKR